MNNIIHLATLNDQEKLSLFAKMIDERFENDLTDIKKKTIIDFLKIIPPFPLDIASSGR